MQPQRSTRTLQAIEAELKEFYSPLARGCALFLGVSGGVDSLLLATLTVRLRERGELPNVKKLFIVHVNHSLRGKEAKQDAQFVKRRAEKWELPYLEKTLAWKAGEKRDQAAARDKRTAFFRECLAREPKSFLVLAHHQDDQAETVLLRLLRGTGLGGLAAMRAADGKVLRPLLTRSREEIESAARALKLKWREDSSNRTSQYERNWLRREVLPMLEARRPGVAGRLAALALEAQTLPREHAAADDPASAAVLRPLTELQKFTRAALHAKFRLDRAHTERLYRFIQTGKASRLSLPGGEAWISAGWFYLANAAESHRLAGRIEGTRRFSSALGTWHLQETGRMKIRGGSASGSVKRALANAKIPAFLREAVPLAIAEEKLVALLPRRWDEIGEYRSADVFWSFRPSDLAKRLFTQGSSGRTEPYPEI